MAIPQPTLIQSRRRWMQLSLPHSLSLMKQGYPARLKSPRSRSPLPHRLIPLMRGRC